MSCLTSSRGFSDFDMDTVIKAAAVALIGGLLGAALKKTSPETALLLAVAVCTAVLVPAIRALSEVREFLDGLSASAALPGETFSIVFKCVGIAVVTRLSADACSDSGMAGVASALEFAGAVSALLVSLPLFSAVLDVIGGLL